MNKYLKKNQILKSYFEVQYNTSRRKKIIFSMFNPNPEVEIFAFDAISLYILIFRAPKLTRFGENS